MIGWVSIVECFFLLYYKLNHHPLLSLKWDIAEMWLKWNFGIPSPREAKPSFDLMYSLVCDCVRHERQKLLPVQSQHGFDITTCLSSKLKYLGVRQSIIPTWTNKREKGYCGISSPRRRCISGNNPDQSTNVLSTPTMCCTLYNLLSSRRRVRVYSDFIMDVYK